MKGNVISANSTLLGRAGGLGQLLPGSSQGPAESGLRAGQCSLVEMLIENFALTLNGPYVCDPSR